MYINIFAHVNEAAAMAANPLPKKEKLYATLRYPHKISTEKVPPGKNPPE